MKQGFYFDTSEFEKDFFPLVEHAIPDKLIEGLKKVGDAVILDAEMLPPTVPFHHGILRDHAKVTDVVKKGSLYIIEMGYNTVYAARLHEAPKSWNWREPGSGPKYLESKIFGLRIKYMMMIADTIKEA